MFSENNIKRWIISLPIIGIIFTSIVLTLLFINQSKMRHENDLIQIEKLYIKNAKKLAKDRILNVLHTINQNELLINFKSKEEFKKHTKEYLNNLRFDNNNYIFTYDLEGNTISHVKQSLVGKNRWDLKKNGKMVVQEIITNGQKPFGHFMQYTATVNPNTNLPAKKISYIKKLDNVDWIIGTGTYVEDLNVLINQKEQDLEKELNETILTTIKISVALTIFGIFIMFLPANNIFEIITRYKKILARKNETLEEKVKERTKEQDILLSLFNEADTVLFKWDYKTSSLLYVSKSISKILGYKEEEFLNHTIKYKNCIHKNDFESYKIQYQNAISDGQQYYEHKPYRIITKDNKIKWIHDYTLFVKDEEGNIESLVGYITDITLLKEHDKIISDQSKMASLGEMIGNIAHQWRQPLSTITTAASGMKLHKELDMLSDKGFYDAINAIMRNSNYLSDTIDDFTNYIKNKNTDECFVLSDVIEKNLLLLEGNIKINYIEIVKDIGFNIELNGNKHELMQVLMNLINNSIDILKSKGIDTKRTIFITTKRSEDSVIIQIKDNAGGIPTDSIDKIFEPYYTTKHKSQGTGLGLYMAHNLIKNMQGDISVSNDTFKLDDNNYTGALFTIELPIKA